MPVGSFFHTFEALFDYNHDFELLCNQVPLSLSLSLSLSLLSFSQFDEVCSGQWNWRSFTLPNWGEPFQGEGKVYHFIVHDVLSTGRNLTLTMTSLIINFCFSTNIHVVYIVYYHTVCVFWLIFTCTNNCIVFWIPYTQKLCVKNWVRTHPLIRVLRMRIGSFPSFDPGNTPRTCTRWYCLIFWPQQQKWPNFEMVELVGIRN